MSEIFCRRAITDTVIGTAARIEPISIGRGCMMHKAYMIRAVPTMAHVE